MSLPPTYVHYGLVASLDVSKIPELKALLEDMGAKLLYQKVSTNRLTIVEKPHYKEEEEI
jgi:hypothetical protein